MMDSKKGQVNFTNGDCFSMFDVYDEGRRHNPRRTT